MDGRIDMFISQIRWDEEEVDGLKDQWRYIITLKQSHHGHSHPGMSRSLYPQTMTGQRTSYCCSVC